MSASVWSGLTRGENVPGSALRATHGGGRRRARRPVLANSTTAGQVAARDVLAPEIGEIIGGSQREERLEVLDPERGGVPHHYNLSK